MKFFPLFILGLIIAVSEMSFKTVDKGYKNKNSFIQTGLSDFKLKLEDLKYNTQLFNDNKINLKKLQKSLSDARNSYKEIEFYIAYHYPEFSKTHLNAAPLFRIEASGTTAYTLPPEGLQVLDELIFSDEAAVQKDKIIEITGFLYNNYNNFYLSTIKNGISQGKNKTLPLRIELIRIYTLGLTGFDTPGSLNVSEEANHAFQGMKNYIQNDRYFKNYKTEIADRMFSEAIEYLSKNKNFETFDRIEFYKKYLQPIYEELGKWDGNKDDLEEFSGWNTSNKNFFSSDFLNPYFFTLLKDSEDNDDLRYLGKKIFYDQNLSANGKMSCSTCHLSENAFTDLQAKSLSNVEGKTVLRNSPSLYNAVFAKRFFYDMRAYYLEQQAEHVIYNSEEFNTSYESIIKKLKANSEYKKLFKKAYREGHIDKQKFSKALSSYVASLYSFDSDFDRFMRNEQEISADAKKGFNLFLQKIWIRLKI